MNGTTFEPNYRILVIDDNPQIHSDFLKILCPATSNAGKMAALVADIFGDQPETPQPQATRFTVDRADQGEPGFQMVAKARANGLPYALAFVDMRMPPGWDGLRTVRAIWDSDPEINIVVCTAYSDSSWADIELLARDSDRLLVLKKPFEPIEVKRLAATMSAKWTMRRQAMMKMHELENVVQERTLLLEQARQRDRFRMDELEQIVQARTAELREAATHDELTGLPNRALFLDRLSHALAISKRNRDFHVAVLFVDFDRFKVINDSLGHATGDLLLRAISERLSVVLRDTDTVTLVEPDGASAARLGGDEFCILLSGIHRDQDAATVAQRILDTLSQPYLLNDREVHSTASIGVTVSSTGYERAEDMVRDADNAMYRAKGAGKGRYVMFDRAMHEQAMHRLMLESDLRKSINLGELRDFYQPIVSLTTGRFTGLESLVRWAHPTRGVVSPAEFISIAEENGFINEVGTWMMNQACLRLADWKRRLVDAQNLTVSVNVSGKQLADQSLTRHVREALDGAGLEPQSLILELTESALIANSHAAESVLAALNEMGVRIYLDDFGTGFCSLSYVHRFPLDGLKIDQSFVREAKDRRRYAAIIRSITNLAENLEIDVIAEGVESLEQVALLQSLDCAKGQGYLFSRPQDPDAVEKMLENPRTDWLRNLPAAA